MLRHLTLGLLVSAIGSSHCPLMAQEKSETQKVYDFECSGTKTQGSGVATGFPVNHPVRVQYQLDLGALTLTEVEIDPPELSAGQKPIAIKIYGKTLITKFRNDQLQKDYEIQIRADERLFSITVFPSGTFEPDAWYGQCISHQSS